MASKASMLKNGVNKASKGLFAGMTPLAAEQQEKKPESAKNVKKTVSEEKVEATEKKAEKVYRRRNELPQALPVLVCLSVYKKSLGEVVYDR